MRPAMNKLYGKCLTDRLIGYTQHTSLPGCIYCNAMRLCWCFLFIQVAADAREVAGTISHQANQLEQGPRLIPSAANGNAHCVLLILFHDNESHDSNLS